MDHLYSAFFEPFVISSSNQSFAALTLGLSLTSSLRSEVSVRGFLPLNTTHQRRSSVPVAYCVLIVVGDRQGGRSLPSERHSLRVKQDCRSSPGRFLLEDHGDLMWSPASASSNRILVSLAYWLQ